MNDKVDTNLSEVHFGYSDEKLEMLSSAPTKHELGIASWATWESENSSFGKTFRNWALYPETFPLFFSCDHGVHWESRCWPNEVESRFKTFFTWNKKKNDLMRKNHGKNSFHVPHPWISYRKKYFSSLPSRRVGTLIFFPHSNSTTKPVYEDLDKYIHDLKMLPEKYQPIVICLLADDIEKGLHKELRKYNIPLITAGALNSQKFVDRFYSMLYQFRFASSSNIGSHTFYIIEAGVPFFLYGPYPEYFIKGSNAVKDGKQNLRDYGDDEDIREFSKLKELLSVQVDEVTPTQYGMVSKYLGMDSQTTRLKASLIIWGQLFLHIDEVISSYARVFGRQLAKLKTLMLAKSND